MLTDCEQLPTVLSNPRRFRLGELTKLIMNATLSVRSPHAKSRKPATDLAVRFTVRMELESMLAHNMQLRAKTNADNFKWLDAQNEQLRVLIDALQAEKPTGELYSMRCASVGNPDHGQYHGEGVASPSLTVESDSLVTLVKIMLAYLSVYDLGSGNMARNMGHVYKNNVMVAWISPNGRVWTPEEFPKCKEIDPVTGKLKEGAQ